jgi:hypothetical protein
VYAAIACNSDAGGGAYTDSAIDQASRAVNELLQVEKMRAPRRPSLYAAYRCTKARSIT